MVSSPIQLIDRQGHFNEDNLKSFLEQTKFPDRSKSYSVVSIVGPQGSGKSTLLNQLCGTNFKVRDNLRQLKTTQGIWIAKFHGIQPFTIAMDIEGTDGRAREGDTTFDKQSALFALEMSDVVLFNMWSHDLGRNEAAGRPLLKIIFQFMAQLFKPRKTTLLFVLRDKATKFSFKDTEDFLKRDIQRIWEGVPKPDAHKRTPLGEFFKVELTALSSYERNERRFKQEVAEMRKRFFGSASTSQGGRVATDRRVVSALDFSDRAHKIWQLITRIQDLNISSVQKIVSTIRCDEIIKHRSIALSIALSTAQLDKAIQVGPQEFAEKLHSAQGTCFSEYDEKTKYYDEAIRTAKRTELQEIARDLRRLAYEHMLKHLFDKAYDSFKRKYKRDASVYSLEQSCVLQFDKGCEDAGIGRANGRDAHRQGLVLAMQAHASSVNNQAEPQPVCTVVSDIARAIASVAQLASCLSGGGARNIM